MRVRARLSPTTNFTSDGFFGFLLSRYEVYWYKWYYRTTKPFDPFLGVLGTPPGISARQLTHPTFGFNLLHCMPLQRDVVNEEINTGHNLVCDRDVPICFACCQEVSWRGAVSSVKTARASNNNWGQVWIDWYLICWVLGSKIATNRIHFLEINWGCQIIFNAIFVSDTCHHPDTVLTFLRLSSFVQIQEYFHQGDYKATSLLCESTYTCGKRTDKAYLLQPNILPISISAHTFDPSCWNGI